MVKIVDNYTLTDFLGKGQYGKVYRAFHMDTRIQVAVKMISLDKFVELSKLTELTRNEIEILKILESNINVVKFVQMIKTNSYVYLVYQYCQEGTLQELLRQRKKLPEKEALAIFRQLILAMKQLHQNSVLHRDIKPNNIFFKSGHLKLADFGFCKRLRSSDDFTQTSLGSPLYMAPEVLNGEVYGSKADLWSCGIVLYQMLFGYCPYGDYNIKEMLSIAVDKASVPFPSNTGISIMTQMMLRRMLEKDQFRRISWQDFFYEYEITSYGTVMKKQKDFEYDLMKLIKRNSHVKPKKETAIKFDWSRITDKNSSVHSEELGGHIGGDEGQLNDLLILKRKIKQFETDHAKMLQVTFAMQNMLDSTKDYQYSNSIIFFLIHTLSFLAQKSLLQIQSFTCQYKDLLEANPQQADQLKRMQVVFANEARNISSKANSIKITLMQCETLNKQIFKFPQKQVVRKFLGNYLKDFEAGSKGSTMLSNQGKKEDCTFLLKVVWGCILAIEPEGKADLRKQRQIRDIPSIKPQTSKFEVSVQLNRLLVYCGI